MEKYRWMKNYQRSLYSDLCAAFKFKSLTDIGHFLGLNNPYHGAKLIFEAQKQNIYLRKLADVKKSANERINDLEITIEKVNKFQQSIDQSLSTLHNSLESVRELKYDFQKTKRRNKKPN
jgi:hypothetical protein